jgi:hypothetical protein
VPCTPGGSCSTDKKGACKAGHYECDAFGKKLCVSNVAPTASDNVCNGIDDDCDGSKDEEVPYPISSCTQIKTAASCGYPSDFTITGQKVCQSGSELCEVKAGVSYCTAASGGPCGRGHGESCDAANKCGIGLVCTTQQGAGPRCLPIEFPQCPPNNLSCYPLNSPYLGGCLP